MKIAFWISGTKDPSPRFRFLQFVEPLRKKGHEVDIIISNPERNRSIKSKTRIFQTLESIIMLAMRTLQIVWFSMTKAKKYDVIFTNKDLVPNLNVLWLEPFMTKFNRNIVFDIDDAIYIGARGYKLKHVLPAYKAVIAGSPILKDFIEDNYGVKGYYIPMAINTANYKPAATREPGKLRIGWSGSHHTNVYALPLLKEPLTALAKELDFEFIVISNKDPEISWPGINTRFIEWTEATEVQGLQLFDIGLMPLKDEPFERGKCALKAVQYMAVGIPPLVSPVGVNSLIIRDGTDGYHCESIQDFTVKLSELARDENKRRELGANALKRVHDLYSVDVLTNEYERVFREIAAK